MDLLVPVKKQRTRINAFFMFIPIMKGQISSPFESPGCVPGSCVRLGAAPGAGAALHREHRGCLGGSLGASASLPFIPSPSAPPTPPSRHTQPENFIYSIC